MEKITGELKISSSILDEIKEVQKNISNFKKKIESHLLEKNTSEILAVILAGALDLEASDIHIEPEEKQTKIRIRIDGMLQDVLVFPQKLYEKLLSRIKLLSGVKLNIADRPQDGRFSIILERKNPTPGIKNPDIEIRTSTLPAEYGESIVMRILNPKSLIKVEKLGLRKDLLNLFTKEIKRPNGMIIITGPTGSGKTTTLYAFLKKLRKPEIKIITIEDPIEYHLTGISQTQTDSKKGYDFARGLRSIMRQDPDVILVGEIRDLETVEIALQASLTGHLVLTTLHTNDAAGTISRLVSLGANPSNVAPAINIAVAQRLLRKVCKKCSETTTISAGTLKEIKDSLKNLPEEINIPEISSKTKIPQVKGCQDCNLTGYKGRLGVFEAFLVNEEMEKFILTSPPIYALKDLAIKNGMTSMYQDGLIKVLQGITTIDEVKRVTEE